MHISTQLIKQLIGVMSRNNFFKKKTKKTLKKNKKKTHE